MKLRLLKFPKHFFMGMLVGASLATILVGALAFERIAVHRAFGEEVTESYINTLKQLEKITEQCGEKCVQ